MVEESCTSCMWSRTAKNNIVCHFREIKKESLCPCIECLVKSMCIYKQKCEKRDIILMDEIENHDDEELP